MYIIVKYSLEGTQLYLLHRLHRRFISNRIIWQVKTPKVYMMTKSNTYDLILKTIWNLYKPLDINGISLYYK